ncbi:hypothetical protein PG984_007843 [Apiospora sp. TS-2023a]
MADGFWDFLAPGMDNRGSGANDTFPGVFNDHDNGHTSNVVTGSFDFTNPNFFDDVFDPIIDDAHFPDVASLPPLEAPLVPPLHFGNHLNEGNQALSFEPSLAPEQSQSVETPAAQEVSRKPRPKAPNAPDWNRQKPKIRELYYEQNKTLEETRIAMKDEHNFEASSNLYKQKFQEWGWVKNLPQSWTPKMVRLAEERRPKDTVFQIGPKRWTMQEVKRKWEKSNNDIGLFQGYIKTMESKCPSPATQYATPWIYQHPSLNFVVVKTDNAVYHGPSREIFSDLQQILTPTHDRTVETAYVLAEALKQDHRVEEADSVLNWVGAQIAHRFGLHSTHTVKHFIRVVNLLRSWLRTEAADLMVWRLADILDNENSSVADIPKIHGSGLGTYLVKSLDDSDIEAMFSPPRDLTQVDTHLRLVELLLATRSEEKHALERVLQSDISFLHQDNTRVGVDSVIDRPVRLLRAYHCLARLRLSSDKEEEVNEVFKDAIKTVKSHCRRIQRSSIDLDFIREAEKFGFLLPGMGKGEEVLQLLAEYLEDNEEVVGKAQLAIQFFLHVGLTLQQRDWSLAKTWFERALALSIIQTGSNSTTTVQLEEALERRWYDVADGGNLVLLFGNTAHFHQPSSE